MIIWWHEYTANKDGSVDKMVKCEKCGTEFVYTLMCIVSGQGKSLFSLDNQGAAARAEHGAEMQLRKQLENGVEVRACPACGHIQKEMLWKARASFLPWMSFHVTILLLMCYVAFAFVTTILNGIVVEVGSLIPWDKFYLALLGIGVLILLMPIVRSVWSLSYDPNRDSEIGKFNKGFYRGTPRAEYERKREEEQENLKNLRERAQRLLDLPHPLKDTSEKQIHDALLMRYLRGGSFLNPEVKAVLQASGMLARSKADRQEGEFKEYFLECARTFDGIYLEVYGSSPKIY